MYDKEYARTSKMCYESLALGENERSSWYDWQTDEKKDDGSGKRQPGYITTVIMMEFNDVGKDR
jgi:hypothetical protein